MTTNINIKNDIQELNPDGDLVELFILDAQALGGGVYYFTTGPLSGETVKWNGIEFSIIPIETEGFEYDGRGKMPRPLIRLSNITYALLGLINSYDDLIGSKVTRYRTYTKYLDNQAEENSSAVFPKDVFYIEKKTRQNRSLIEFQLKAAIDLQGLMIPRRPATELCMYRYRRYVNGAFVYDDVLDPEVKACPYTTEADGAYWNEAGIACSASEDKCGKKASDCQLRFPTGGLYTLGFPSIGRMGYPYR